MAKTICLFTAHSPISGGGAVILRSLIENLPELNVQWKYVAEKPIENYENGHLGKGFMGGPILSDIFQTWLMLSDRKVNKINEIVNQLLDVESDAYWVVSHNEGIRVALELARLQNKRPVHLTIQDDWAASLCAKSFRYRLMTNIANKLTKEVFNKIESIDVISKSMQHYYEKFGVKANISHRFLPTKSLKINHIDNNDLKNNSILNIGHIGSIYDIKDFIIFLNLLKEIEKLKERKVILHMWGFQKQKDKIPAHFLELLEIHQDLPENKVIPLLSNCDVVYAMYPSAKRLSIFTQTSLPTKLSSYVQAGIPIFGHSPVGSTLDEFISNTSTGVLWSSGNFDEGINLIDKAISLSHSSMNWEKARKEYFGENNLLTIQLAFQS